MINIISPSSVKILMKYLGVAVGEIDEIKDMIPNLIKYMIDSDEISDSDIVLYDKFKENGNILNLLI